MNRTITIVFVVGLLVVTIGVGVGVSIATGEIKDAFVPALTAALVWVTAFYAVATGQIMETSKKQVEASERQAAIMLESQLNAAAPVVTFEADLGDPYHVRIYLFNTGKGPALNFRCWIEDPEHPELRVVSRAILENVIPVTSSSSTHWHSIPVPEGYRWGTGYTLGTGYIRAQYESIFGKTYESCLIFPKDKSAQLEWSEAKEVIKL